MLRGDPIIHNWSQTPPSAALRTPACACVCCCGICCCCCCTALTSTRKNPHGLSCKCSRETSGGTLLWRCNDHVSYDQAGPWIETFLTSLKSSRLVLHLHLNTHSLGESNSNIWSPCQRTCGSIWAFALPHMQWCHSALLQFCHHKRETWLWAMTCCPSSRLNPCPKSSSQLWALWLLVKRVRDDPSLSQTTVIWEASA